MSVTADDLRHIAALARLELAEDRVAPLVRELNGILAHMDVLQQVEMQSEQDAGASDVPTGMPLRADVPSSVMLQVSRAEFAPAVDEDFFLVPRLSTHE